MTPERLQRIRTVLDRRQPDLTVLMDNVHKPHNFSAIVRSCDAVGIHEVHGVWPSSTLRPRNHASGGSGKWVTVRTHKCLDKALGALHAQGFTICAAHLSGHALDFREVDYTRPTAIVLGAELQGLSDNSLRLADKHMLIPMEGMVQSLNVSVAAAVVLFEAQRQRREAGLYDQPRLDASVYARTLFEWLHPQVAAYCKRKNRPYPEVDECGEIVEFIV